jgi:hypothetical protein
MRIPAAQIEKQVLDATKSVIASRRVPSHVNVSGRTVGSHPMVGEPCQELSVHEKVLDAIERVTAGMSCYSVAYEITPARAEFLVVDAVPRNRSPKGQFPANREKNRECV